MTVDAHPSRAFTGRAQVLQNWTGVFAGVPDFTARLLASTVDEDRASGKWVEWGDWDWSGSHSDGTTFAMRGVTILTARDDRIVEARLYVEPVDPREEGIDESVAQLYRPPSE